MSNKYLDSKLLDKAIEFAVKAHANTERRGKGFPYIVHPLEVVSVVASMTSDQELLAAAALHDTVEDTDVTIEQIRAEFGDRVADLVSDESEERTPGLDKVASWHSRKEAAINHLAHASMDAKMVAMGDKLSNMRAIFQDYHAIGDELWQRFHAPNGRADHEWHYRGLADALKDLADTFAYQEFVYLIDVVFGKQKPDFLNMDDYEQSGDGFASLTYNHKDGKSMVKLYSDFIPSNLPARELQVSAVLEEMGLRVPKAYRLVTDGVRIGVEFERINPKKSFARAISVEPEKLEEYAVRFARLTKKLHETPCRTDLFPSAKDVFRQSVKESRNYDDAQKAKINAFIDSVPDATTCLHGDLHIGNIITNGIENYWIDLADFHYGCPLFDLGMVYFTCHCDDDDLTFKLYHVHNKEMQEVWRIFVREYFGADTPEGLAEIDAKVLPYACLMMVFLGNRGPMFPFMRKLVEDTLLS